MDPKLSKIYMNFSGVKDDGDYENMSTQEHGGHEIYLEHNLVCKSYGV